ncbi:MAG: hypothetical protein AAF394_16715 [Planctomycetota bacterium]
MQDAYEIDSASSGMEQKQLSMLDIFWLITAVAAILAYARNWGEATVQQAIVYMVLVLVLGGIAGLIAGQLKDALFWSGLTCLVAFIATAGGRLPSTGVLMGWGAVGALCGAQAGVGWPIRWWLAIPVSAILGLVGMLLTLVCLSEPFTGLVQFDLGTAAVVGAIVYPFLQFLQDLEHESKQPRVVLTAWLTLVFLLGNYLVPIIGGVQR